MGEQEAIKRADEPVTVDRIVGDLQELGVDAGDALVVHSSLSSLGWVVGGPQTVVDALRRAVGESGTVVVPTHTAQYSDPSDWSNPPVPEEWYEAIRSRRPPYRPAVTPSRSMGAIPECLRTYPEAVRSRHPVCSFAAIGPDAGAIVGDHAFDYSLGDGSPLARVYERGGSVLLLGVGHEVNTSIHLAEYRADLGMEPVEATAPILRDGERVEITYDEVETSTDDFEDLGADFERRICCRTGIVGEATAKLLDQASLVDFAVEWLEENR